MIKLVPLSVCVLQLLVGCAHPVAMGARGITGGSDASEAKVTVAALPDRPGIAAKLFRALADENVNVDMIEQNVSTDDHTDISFTIPRDELTRKVTEAMRHPAVSCLSHPKGRIINHRPENALDLERTFEVALETGVAVETNGLPDRLDLKDVYVRQAIEAGVPICCSTDAHSVRGLGNMALSVSTARRGWATAAHIVNTRSLAELPLRR